MGAYWDDKWRRFIWWWKDYKCRHCGSGEYHMLYHVSWPCPKPWGWVCDNKYFDGEEMPEYEWATKRV